MKKEKYSYNRRILIKLLSLSVSREVMTQEQLIIMQREGSLPETWNVHHILPKKYGGDNSLGNLCIIPYDKHIELSKELNKLKPKFFNKKNYPFLKDISRKYGGILLKYNRYPNAYKYFNI